MTDLTMSQFASKDDLLAAQAARIAELEAQLDAIGAGGVEPLRKPAAPQAVQAAVPTDDELTMAWIAAGGVFFGPNTPTGSMPEAKLFPFLRQLAATQPAAQGAVTTGYIAPKGRYVPPVLFSPYTGEPRDARDIASDPRGILIVPPGAALAAQAKQGGADHG